MGAPVFTQQEVAMLMALPKRTALPESMSGAEIAAIGAPAGIHKSLRPGTSQRKRTIKVEPEDATLPVEFVLEVTENPHTDEFSLTLHAKYLARPSYPLCRFDIQDGSHANPEWFPPPHVASGVPHVHVYSERGEKERDSWDCCAEPLSFGAARKLSKEQERDRLKGILWKRCKIRFIDRDSVQSLFDETP
jgi:hypothetical protein